MKSFLTFVAFALLLGAWAPGEAKAQTVTRIIGGNVACDPNVDTCLSFPSQASLLCDGSGVNLDCPQYFHPDWSQAPGTRFFGVTNRTNPPRYLVSTNGSTWSLVPVQPFVAAVLNLGGFVAVSTDGSILAISGQGANTCIIRRSTDQGNTWTTVFTSAVQACSLGFGAPSPPNAHCSEVGGYCVFSNAFNVATVTDLYSTDNGQNWTIGVPYGYVSADSQVWTALDNSGSPAIQTRGLNNAVGQPFGIQFGSDFQATPNWVPAAGGNWACRPYIQAGSNFALCARNSAPFNTFQIVNGTIPVEVGAQFSLADLSTTSQSEPMVHGFQDSFTYLTIPSISVTNRLNLYISTAALAGGASLAGTMTHSAVIIGGCCRGNFITWGSKIYFTNGATGGNAWFGRIQ